MSALCTWFKVYHHFPFENLGFFALGPDECPCTPTQGTGRIHVKDQNEEELQENLKQLTWLGATLINNASMP